MKLFAVAILALSCAGCSIALDPIERWSSSKTEPAAKKEPAAQPAAQPAPEPNDVAE